MKTFVPYELVRNNALKLSHQIYCDGFTPDVIYVILRGGAYLGNVISEYFKLVSDTLNLKPVLYAAVVARSYHNPVENSSPSAKVSIDSWTYNPEYLRDGDRVLLIDDIYDTGNTINRLASIVIQSDIRRHDLKIAVHDYKERPAQLNATQPHAQTDEECFLPDYYCRKLCAQEDGGANWIHYLSHELVGLTESEIKTHYPKEAQAILIDQHSKIVAR